ncbi:hypothetical protein VAE308_1140010 [Vibrio aestuarianus]|uniref:Uncharacterized protein n=1 Tax=Vibrio aestuarianus TaxID=28171 RepID=A0ABN8TKY6_9VIBR|nr:hypothetical protein [Vibrio aestuarianus]MDE1258078.1 hypothetical protein [Vibrio aestuarianus]NLS59428.1 hypothetical protein [Vibrio aestuarianus subsp. francensis]CAH8187938.1 hypothetical protein VAE063_1000010 [Vibrio aestuarianus]CAH8214251.1 hypothetical protein VAE308_1140010 [Vibrio aestuarianus]
MSILDLILSLDQKFLIAANAQLSGEQRTGQAAALHRKALYLTHSKTATR